MVTTLCRWNRETVSPRDIDVQHQFFGLFGSIEAALTATMIIRLCQEELKGWLWFTEPQLTKLCRQKSEHYPVKLKELVEGEFLTKRNGQYQVTHEFVRRCYLSRPANGATTEAPQHGVAPA